MSDLTDDVLNFSDGSDLEDHSATKEDTPPTTNSKRKTTNRKKGVMQFKPDEMKMFDEVSKELGVDNKGFDDLKAAPEPVQDPSQEEIIDLINNKDVKTTLVNPGESPPISNLMEGNDEIGMITDDEIRKIKDENDQERKRMQMILGTKDSMNLDIKIGMKDGKSVFIQKKYYFNSITKREEMQLGMMRARLNQINTEYQVTARKSWDQMNDEEVEFVSLAPAMIEIGSYKLSEFEAKLRLGMSPDDFARVDVIQYGFALQVIGWRTLNPRLSRQGR